MRLICPNCGAQYAVAEDVIPAGGRDVQCSNCAHTWFETPGASSDDTPPPPRKPRPTPPATAEGGRFDGSIADAFKDDNPSLAPAPQAPATRKKTVDPSVASILQEEAERETAKRRQEAPATMEGQTDLGLNEPTTAKTKRPDPVETREAAKTAAAATGAVAVGAAAEGGNRRELLPDIEEINSSLRSDTERAESGELAAHNADQQIQQRRGFRRGFILVLLLIAILVAIYVQADALKAAVPALAETVDSYVASVDAGRNWLDANVRAMLTSAESTTPES